MLAVVGGYQNRLNSTLPGPGTAGQAICQVMSCAESRRRRTRRAGIAEVERGTGHRPSGFAAALPRAAASTAPVCPAALGPEMA